jgi:hypothetical protein
MGKHNHLDLDRIAFIGRTYSEYLRMFWLNEAIVRRGPVLDCAGGPSSFAAEAHQSGFDVTACDVLYNLPAEQLMSKGGEDIAHVFSQFDEVAHLYTWKYYGDKNKIMTLRRNALDAFSRDFDEGCFEGRYIQATLPRLPFPDKSYALVLCSHFLFLYGDRLGLEFHRSCLKDSCASLLRK